VTDARRSAERWKQEADALLAESALLDTLGRFGHVELSGSYAYDLMMSPDIDLHLVASECTHGRAAALAHELMEEGWWMRVTLEDRVRWPYPGLPNGYYIGTRAEFREQTWKVDTWMLDASRYPGDVWWPRIAGISDEQRDAILHLKAARTEGLLSASGVEIYRSVIDDGVRTIEEFRDRSR
jgi:hypothetical protein